MTGRTYSDETLQVDVDISRSDLFFVSWRTGNRLWWMFALFFLIVAGISLLTQQQPKAEPRRETYYIAFAVIQFGVFVLLWQAGCLLMAIIVVLGTTRTGGVLGPHHFEIRDDGLYESTPVNQSLYRWNSFHRISRNRHGIELFLGWWHVFLIPSRSFPNLEVVQVFYAEVRTRMNHSKENSRPSQISRS